MRSSKNEKMHLYRYRTISSMPRIQVPCFVFLLLLMILLCTHALLQLRRLYAAEDMLLQYTTGGINVLSGR